MQVVVAGFTPWSPGCDPRTDHVERWICGGQSHWSSTSCTYSVFHLSTIDTVY